MSIVEVILLFILFALIMFGIMSACIFEMISKLGKYLNDKNDIEITKLEMNVVSRKEDFDIIDLMITEEINKYHLTVNEPNMVEYMGDESVVEMEKYILKRVFENISPIHLEKLKYIYNLNKLEDIIYEKVRLAVISYSSDLNSSSNNG